MGSGAKSARELAREHSGGNPLRASLLLLTIMALLGASIAWAAMTELDAVTRTDGRVVPSAEVQLVQASEPGLVSKIHVSEGDVVRANAPLVTLDETQIEGELAQAEARVLSLRLRIARLKAEIEDTEFLPEFGNDAESIALVSSEVALYAARRAALRDEVGILLRQRRQREQAVIEAQTRLETAEEALALIKEEQSVISPLVDEGVEPRTTLIGLLGRLAEAEGRVSEARAGLGSAEAAVLEIDDRMVSERSSSQAQSLEQLALAESELAEVLVRLPALESRLLRSVLRAPTRGVVNRVLVGTMGALAPAGEPLVELVPIEDELLVEAYLPPEDVAFVSTGQDVKVSLTAYDASRYGSIDGTILRVGADATLHPDREERVFVIVIRTEGALTDADDQQVEVLPGMVAQIDILSGKRTVLEYLSQPVVRVKETALRE
ncbi:MAG: HlyD family type I secretion periplasmic adaptor subunit [Pseudomonadota bacterium]